MSSNEFELFNQFLEWKQKNSVEGSKVSSKNVSLEDSGSSSTQRKAMLKPGSSTKQETTLEAEGDTEFQQKNIHQWEQAQ